MDLKLPPAHDRQPAPDLASSARTIDKAHGRMEIRQLGTSRECVAHLAWPGVAQILRIERIREQGGKRSREIAYAITSLTPEQAGPDALLALWRDHWLIENRLHWRRDVILREDQSRIRCAAAPQGMAALRNALLHLVRNEQKPLSEIRATFAENRINAIQAARQGVL